MLAMQAEVLHGASLVRRQIEQLQSSASGRLPPHLSGTPLRPRLTRARTNLDVVWRSRENRDPVGAAWAARTAADAGGVVPPAGLRPRQDQGNALAAMAHDKVSRSVTHLHQVHLGDGGGKDAVDDCKGKPPARQPLRAIQGTEPRPPAKSAASKPVKPKQTVPDAVYQTIDERVAQPAHYDMPVSPPVPVDPSKRKRKAEGPEAAGAALLAAKPCPRGPKPSAKTVLGCGHRSLPRKLTGMSVVEINLDLENTPDRQKQGRAVAHPDPERAQAPAPTSTPTPDSSSCTLPHKKSARGGQLWRRFSSFNPCNRWDEWNSSKKGDVKRPASIVKTQSDQRPPVPNRPLPPTPRPEAEKICVAESTRGGLLPANLEHHPWFHNVDRKQAEELIKNGIDGYFLIRPSSQSQNPLTLTLWYNQRVYNISVRQRKDGRIALGFEKPDEQSFLSIEEMVMNYQSENLLLFSRNERTGRTVLTKSPPKQSH